MRLVKIYHVSGNSNIVFSPDFSHIFGTFVAKFIFKVNVHVSTRVREDSTIYKFNKE